MKKTTSSLLRFLMLWNSGGSKVCLYLLNWSVEHVLYFCNNSSTKSLFIDPSFVIHFLPHSSIFAMFTSFRLI